MRVLFLSANLGGNVPPTLAIARRLSGRGVEVEVAGIDVGAPADVDSPALAQVPASWAPKHDTAGVPEPLGPSLARIFLSRRLVDEAESLIRARRPDVVVVDCMALALAKGANRSGVPVVVLLHTLAEYWRRPFFGRARRGNRRRPGLLTSGALVRGGRAAAAHRPGARPRPRSARVRLV